MNTQKGIQYFISGLKTRLFVLSFYESIDFLRIVWIVFKLVQRACSTSFDRPKKKEKVGCLRPWQLIRTFSVFDPNLLSLFPLNTQFIHNRKTLLLVGGSLRMINVFFSHSWVYSKLFAKVISVTTIFWAKVLCSLAAEDACFRMRITLGVVLIRSLVFQVSVPECSRNGSGMRRYLLVQEKFV